MKIEPINFINFINFCKYVSNHFLQNFLLFIYDKKKILGKKFNF